MYVPNLKTNSGNILSGTQYSANFLGPDLIFNVFSGDLYVFYFSSLSFQKERVWEIIMLSVHVGLAVLFHFSPWRG
jgi:hypothetical protein